MLKNVGQGLLSGLRESFKLSSVRCLQTTTLLLQEKKKKGWENRTEHFLSYNNKVYPPQAPDEPRRPAYVCHTKESIKYSYKKMWYIAAFIRGMTIDDALQQLKFINKKGAGYVRDALLEAQDIAVTKHNVEFKSNLWISESFCGKSIHIKGLRRHAKVKFGEIRYQYTHYFVTLEEGTPPEHYYYHYRDRSPEEWLQIYMDKWRQNRIYLSL